MWSVSLFFGNNYFAFCFKSRGYTFVHKLRLNKTDKGHIFRLLLFSSNKYMSKFLKQYSGLGV